MASNAPIPKTPNNLHLLSTNSRVSTLLNWVVQNVNLAPLTTWRIGGQAQYYGIVTNLNMLLDSIQAAKEEDLPLYILGSGSNILIDDSGVPGLIIRLAGEFKAFQRIGPNIIRVGAGFPMPRLAKIVAEIGYAGFEHLIGIPGTVGAGVVINAGKSSAGPNMSSILESVHYIDESLQEKDDGLVNMELAYRSSRLKLRPAIVVHASFSLEKSDEPATIQERMRAILAERKGKFPLNYPNAGSVFKQPEGQPPAGWLIEKAGLKGYQIGNAQVSRKHGNFIVNLGRATSADVKRIISLIQEKVYKVHRVELEREVIYWPEETNWKT